MLKEIRCPFFKHEKISFHSGLNIILGDDDAKNSIGKSTALMVIDFVHGGDSFIKDEAGAIKALGHHHYNFFFVFNGRPYYFSRSTDVSDVVFECDEDYKRFSEISVDVFRKTLKDFYGLVKIESSFRSTMNPFARIWKKGGLEPDQPFISALKESSGTAIARLIDLFDRSEDIAAERRVIDEQKDRKKLITDSMNANIIPSINKTKHGENLKIINENVMQIERLKAGFGGALNAYEALFTEDLRRLAQRKNELINLRDELQSKAKRLQREISGITPRIVTNIALVSEFFPTVDVTRLEQVETFHQKIGSIVKKELKSELDVVQLEESTLTIEIVTLESQIQTTLRSKGMPDDLFRRVFELKEITDNATEENKYFEQKEQLKEVIKISGQRLDVIYEKIFLDIEAKINLKLKAFNKVVYGPTRNSSELRIKNANSYNFSSPDDTGTGKSYAGLIGFDLAMLSLTSLPFVIHDSVIYKNIEVAATKRILKILAAPKTKQIFLSFDEAKKFGSEAEQLIKKFTILKLSYNDLLYSKDWRDKK
ncbi:DUF2326 domain-containing protein [Undibacterium amnicola]|uniref:DUF2326 domain-containing protein n=1 Tax=Undibacterium amnicola TaxID=1834038 RepID=A0ABR6XN92_9BURK|nr:DUF2326 domain-containing protein [Undibacterium amnicola]MBC3830843.1 DUF2326 domain-containing protein [Undibacterium amnicola]